jgi:hypothetical protein
MSIWIKFWRFNCVCSALLPFTLRLTEFSHVTGNFVSTSFWKNESQCPWQKISNILIETSLHRMTRLSMIDGLSRCTKRNKEMHPQCRCLTRILKKWPIRSVNSQRRFWMLFWLIAVSFLPSRDHWELLTFPISSHNESTASWELYQNWLRIRPTNVWNDRFFCVLTIQIRSWQNISSWEFPNWLFPALNPRTWTPLFA